MAFVRNSPSGELVDTGSGGAVTSDDVENLSTVAGANVTDALNALIDAIGVGPTTALLGHTGWISGGLLSVNAGNPALFDYTLGSGWVINHSDPTNPIATEVVWPAASGVSVDNLATSSSTGISFNDAGTLTQNLNGQFTLNERRELIIIGIAVHPSNVAIDAVSTTPSSVAWNGILSFEDFIREVIGPANVIGNIYSDNGANLEITKSAGQSYIIGISARTNPQSPNVSIDPQLLGPQFRKLYRSGVPFVLAQDGGFVTDIEPGTWDDGSGTLQTVSVNDWTVQVIYWFPDTGVGVSYGQEVFNTQQAAIDAVNNGTLNYIEFPQLAGTSRRSFLVVEESATDLSDPAQATFIEAPAFRGASTSGTGSSALVFPTFVFNSPDFSDPNNADWALNSLALIAADSNNIALSVRLFDDTTEQGVGMEIPIPTAALSMDIVIVSRAETSPGGAVTVQPALYHRSLSVDAAVTAWSAANQLTPLDIPSNEFWQYDIETFNIATLGAIPGSVNQFMLTRQGSDANDTLSGDWALLQVLVRFS